MSEPADLGAAIDAIVERYGFRHSRFGVAIHALDDGTPRYERDAEFFFQGASTTKVPTVAAAMAALGADFRFRTTVRHTGELDAAGVLHGDLILVASGDPNLSARVQLDDTLAFRNIDHVLSGMTGSAVVAGDPLLILRRLAAAVAEKVKRIEGRVLVDIALFDEGFREPGTGVVLSPIVVNDNVIDLTARGGSAPGDPVHVTFAPVTRYCTFVMEAVTGEPGSAPALTVSAEERDESGGRIVRIGGTMPPGAEQLYVHPVETPSVFARTLLIELLEERGVVIDANATTPNEGAPVAPAILAEHVSPPFSQAAKIVLKVSQNLHAEMCSRLVGAYVAGARGADAEKAGFAQLARYVDEIVTDTDGIVQGDGCGMYGYYTPAFMCRLLRALAAQPTDTLFRAALPIIGRDGTTFNIVPEFAAAGHVFAKTGTHGFDDKLQPRAMVLAKGLAGYIEAASGATYVFATYVNQAALQPGETATRAGMMLGEVAAAAYDRL